MTFVNITREPADDWIGTGIAETVSSDLKNIHGLTVIGRARVYDAVRNLSSTVNLDESLAIDIGRRLGATWVVVGGFQKMGELVRITANFVEVASGAVRRTVKLDGRIADIFALQDKIVYELSQGLNLALRGTEIAGIERRETRSVDAYESYARGMMNLRLATRDSIERAISAFEEATSPRSRVRDRVGGARRRLSAQGLVHEHQRAGAQGRRHGAARARHRSRPRRRARAGSARRWSRSGTSTKASPRSRTRSVSSRRTVRPTRASRARCGSARETSPARSRCSSDRSS